MLVMGAFAMPSSLLAFRGRLGLTLLASALALAGPLRAQQADPADPPANQGEEPQPTLTETIQVTATRAPEDVEALPASVTVISGEELLARGATDLASALALTAGVAVAPGGDTGPAGSVPELWGLREFDAFLLVVDGVPWGGAFNPALTTLDLHGVERIEILRGPAPVMYGATSFVGVIHVLHRAPGAGGRRAELSGGSYGSGSAAVWTPLPAAGGFAHSLAADVERQGFKDDRTQFDRGHVLYRASRQAGAGSFRFDADVNFLRQDPASPTPRTGAILTPLVPLDTNQNPRGAHVDDDRFHVVGGYDRTLSGGGTWSSTLAFTHTKRDTLRGFLAEVSESDPNAVGFRQDLELDDVYLDSHVILKPSPALQVVAGFDHLYGKATADSEDFDYFVHLNGAGAPDGGSIPGAGFFDLEDERNFSGLYGQLEWTPAPRWRFDLGARLNRTSEDREAHAEELEEGGEEGEEEGGRDSLETTRGSGVLGVSWLAWQGDAGAALWLFADARRTFKPAALDFGPEAEDEILEPETAKSYEAGAKGRGLAGRLDWEVSLFQMDFRNLVLSSLVDGLPRLINAGRERFKGGELEVRWRLDDDLLWSFAYANHDARFQDFVREFDGSLRQLRGNRLELSARHLGSTGIVYSPARGWFGSLLASYTGSRFLNQRNTALAPSFTTWSAGIGYRFPTWELRLDGENLSDERDPVAESELGDAQYYRQPARSVRLGLATRF
jgi:outer membrane receptor protein involved in Fe transport